jgi:hypothetical protein
MLYSDGADKPDRGRDGDLRIGPGPARVLPGLWRVVLDVPRLRRAAEPRHLDPFLAGERQLMLDHVGQRRTAFGGLDEARVNFGVHSSPPSMAIWSTTRASRRRCPHQGRTRCHTSRTSSFRPPHKPLRFGVVSKPHYSDRCRRIADVADCGLGRLNWAGSGASLATLCTAGVRPKHALVGAERECREGQSSGPRRCPHFGQRFKLGVTGSS